MKNNKISPRLLENMWFISSTKLSSLPLLFSLGKILSTTREVRIIGEGRECSEQPLFTVFVYYISFSYACWLSMTWKDQIPSALDHCCAISSGNCLSGGSTAAFPGRYLGCSCFWISCVPVPLTRFLSSPVVLYTCWARQETVMNND